MPKILFAASEIHPLMKTGGLADVAAGLPAALKGLRQDIRLIMPAYPLAVVSAGRLKLVAELNIAGAIGLVRVLEGYLPESKIPLWLIDAPYYFDRPGGPYADAEGVEFSDNAARFGVFNRAIVQLALNRAGLAWQPDIVHCNDWQTGLVPALLAPEPKRPATVFTIHNLAYQGLFPWQDFQALGLPAELWSFEALEFHDKLSFIKGGLVFADWLTTVSPTYAREILTPELGAGLDGLLTQRAARLTGILNGADYAIWDPARDPFIVKNYDHDTLRGKAANKVELQRHFHLPSAPRTPLLALVGRLVEQKGVDLLLEVIPELMQRNLQLVVLGSGDPVLESALIAFQQRYPGRIGLQIGYDEALSHRVEAGADIFLMPSRFEPCGLNQIYSLRYGTAPIVRRTGGLADTVVDATSATLQNTTATGFMFDDISAVALFVAIDRALALFARPRQWKSLMMRGMRQDFSWRQSALRYLEVYKQAEDSVIGHAETTELYPVEPMRRTGTLKARNTLQFTIDSKEDV